MTELLIIFVIAKDRKSKNAKEMSAMLDCEESLAEIREDYAKRGK